MDMIKPQSGLPIYVGVGAAKSGTTWWHSLIRRHPEVSDAPKEFKHFVNPMGEQTPASMVETYSARFERDSMLIQGEWTPRYMFDPWGIPLLHEAAPEARVVLILRDPLARMVSGYAHSSRQNLASKVWMLNDAIQRSLYAVQLERVFKYYSPESVLALQFELVVGDPIKYLRETYKHIGCEDQQFVPESVNKQINVTPGDKPQMPRAVVRAARAAFSEEAQRISSMLPGFDLSLWPSSR